MLRRHTPSASAPQKGNIGLAERYAEAWTRIKESIEEGFFFEAIAIEESIISNRLVSFLYGVGKVTDEEAGGKRNNGKPCHLSFKTIIDRWGKVCNEDTRWENPGTLIGAVNLWRELRNEALHGLAKSFPGGEPAFDVETYLYGVGRTAKRGSTLARQVSKWQKRQKTRAKMHGLLPKT